MKQIKITPDFADRALIFGKQDIDACFSNGFVEVAKKNNHVEISAAYGASTCEAPFRLCELFTETKDTYRISLEKMRYPRQVNTGSFVALYDTKATTLYIGFWTYNLIAQDFCTGLVQSVSLIGGTMETLNGANGSFAICAVPSMDGIKIGHCELKGTCTDTDGETIQRGIAIAKALGLEHNFCYPDYVPNDEIERELLKTRPSFDW